MIEKWWKEAVVYQIYPRSFYDSNGDGIGDIIGIIKKLDYLVELGIDVIWISPMYKSPNYDNGYDISDYQSVMEEFGTMEDFEKLLSEAHKRGLKIMIDLVVNHTSSEHPWFIESRKSKDNQFRDYYIWRNGKDGKEPNNWGACFGGSTWEYDKESDMYYLHLFSKNQPDLNWDNPKVRNEIFKMMNWWCEKGIDGFRMDVISYISKDKNMSDGEINEKGYGDFNPYCTHGPKVHEYLKEMNEKVLSKYNLITVGETAGVTVEEAKKYASSSGEELNMIFQFEHMDLDGGESFKWNKRKMDLIKLKDTLSKWQTELYENAWNSLYWCNHDQPRIVSRLGNDSDEYREVSAKMLATCIHMMQGTPYIYQGEEIAMTNVPFKNINDFRDIESLNAFKDYTENGRFSSDEMLEYLKYKSRDNARTPMQWNSEKNAGFTLGEPWIMVNPNYKKINVEEQISRPDSVFNYYKNLIAVRNNNKIVVYGSYELIDRENKNVYSYLRILNDEKLFVACNFSNNEVILNIPKEFNNESSYVLINNYNLYKIKGKNTLMPYEAIVIKGVIH